MSRSTTDFSWRYIFFKLNGKRYCISFHDTFMQGVYDVEIREGTDGKAYRKADAIIEECYPGVLDRLKARITFLKSRNKMTENELVYITENFRRLERKLDQVLSIISDKAHKSNMKKEEKVEQRGGGTHETD